MALAKNVALCKDARKRTRSRAVLAAYDNAINRGISSKSVCSKGFGKCDAYADVGVAFFSLHDMAPSQVLNAMEKKGMTKLFFTAWLPDELAVLTTFSSKEKGYWFRPHVEQAAHRSAPSSTLFAPYTLERTVAPPSVVSAHVEMGYFSTLGLDIAEPYIHRRSTLLEWALTACVSNNRYHLYIEIIQDNGPIKTFSCSRVVHALNVARVWRTGFEGYTRVAKLRPLSKCGWEASNLRECDWITMPSDNVDAVYQYLMSAEKATMEIAYKYARARQGQLEIGADVIRKRWEVTGPEMDEIVATLFVVTHLQRIRRDKTVKKAIQRINNPGFWDYIRDCWRTQFPAFSRMLNDYVVPADFIERASSCVVALGGVRASTIMLPWAPPEFEEDWGCLTKNAPEPSKVEIPPRYAEDYLTSLEAPSESAMAPIVKQVAGLVRGKITPTAVCLSDVTFVEGPPGCGKTHYARNNLVSSSSLIVCPTRVLAADWMAERIAGAKVATQHTALALLVGGHYSQIVVDEASLLPIGYFALLRQLAPQSDIYLLGDPRQISYIDWSHTITNAEEQRVALFMDRFKVKPLRDNYRNPPGTVKLVNQLFGYDMVSRCEKDVPWLSVADQNEAIEFFPAATIMTFGQAAKQALATQFPAREVCTVQELQGSTRNDIILYVDEDSFPVRNADQEAGHLVVAFTRHRDRLITTVAHRAVLQQLVDCEDAYVLLEANYNVSPALGLQAMVRDPIKVLSVFEEEDSEPDVTPISPAEADLTIQRHFPSRVEDIFPAEVIYDRLPQCVAPIKLQMSDIGDTFNPTMAEYRYANTALHGKWTAGAPISTAHTMINRFGRPMPLPPREDACKVEARRLCDQLITKAMKAVWTINEDDFYLAMERSVINQRAKGTLKMVTILEEAMSCTRYDGFQKKQMKVKAGACDPSYANKGGQTIVSPDKSLNTVMGPLAQFISDFFKQNLKPQFVLHDGRTIEESCAHLMVGLSRGLQFGGTDLKEQDSSFCYLHHLVKYYLAKALAGKLLEAAGRLLGVELNRMLKWKVFVRSVISMLVELMNHSGNSWTLIANSNMSLSLLFDVVEASDDLALVYVGDDTGYVATKLEYNDQAIKKLNDMYGTVVKKEEMRVLTFCKHFVTATGVYQDLVKVATSVINKPYRDEKAFNEYKDALKDYQRGWGDGAKFERMVAVAAAGHDIPVSDVRFMAGVVPYVEAQSWADFERDAVAPPEHTIVVVSPESIRESAMRIDQSKEVAKLLKNNPLVAFKTDHFSGLTQPALKHIYDDAEQQRTKQGLPVRDRTRLSPSWFRRAPSTTSAPSSASGDDDRSSYEGATRPERRSHIPVRTASISPKKPSSRPTKGKSVASRQWPHTSGSSGGAVLWDGSGGFANPLFHGDSGGCGVRQSSGECSFDGLSTQHGENDGTAAHTATRTQTGAEVSGEEGAHVLRTGTQCASVGQSSTLPRRQSFDMAGVGGSSSTGTPVSRDGAGPLRHCANRIVGIGCPAPMVAACPWCSEALCATCYNIRCPHGKE